MMGIRLRRSGFALLAALLACGAVHTQVVAFELVDGDRVVWVGGTFVERAQATGYEETRLVARWPQRNFTFRNLGWSGDTVWADARAGFDTPADGFRRLGEMVESLRPTVVIVAYGSNEAFAGPDGLGPFREQLGRMLDMLTAGGARLVLVAPNRLEDLGRPLPDPAPQNGRLAPYVSLLAEVAQQRKAAWADLFAQLQGEAGRPLTDNGLHLNDYGSWEAARALEQAFELPPPAWQVTIDAGAQPRVVEAVGTQIELAGPLEFTALDATLPIPPPPASGGASAVRGEPRVLKVAGLDAGRYTLTIDGEPIHTASAADWAAGIELRHGPELVAVEQLREAIRWKNQLYFYRWRPQNDTYLFGFRKYEQGQNAKEVDQFDPLIAEKEAEIARLRRPQIHLYRLIAEVSP